MSARRAATLAALLVLPLATQAQRLPSDDRRPPLTRKENWGLSIGVEMIRPTFQPTRCPTVQHTSTGNLINTTVPCDDVPYAYSTHGIGVSMNAGLIFLRHFMFGGEIGTVGFSGSKTFTDTAAIPPESYTASTTNSLFGSWYVGLITSPIGKDPRQGRKVWAGGLFGWSKWSGERGVKSCAQCVVEPLPMGTAYYVQPFVMFGGGNKDGGGGLRLAYRHYAHGRRAMHGTLTFGLFFAFGRL